MALLSPAECRQLIADIGRLMYDRRLTDSAGGNLSARASDGDIYMTPRYSGSRLRWRLRPDHVVRVSPSGELLEGDGEVSREFRMHLAIYARFAECGGICHAHPHHLLVFASAERPLPPASEQTDKYGTIPLTRKARAHTEDLADVVVEALVPQSAHLTKQAIACLLPRHGITVAGATLADAYDALERLDGSAKIWIDRAALFTADRTLAGSDAASPDGVWADAGF